MNHTLGRDLGHAPGHTLQIGVFDSGFGGLTVLRALLPQLPTAEFTYLGDTARLPYGSKSKATIERYAADSARLLVHQGAESLVIACNTASALALDAIRNAVPVPVLGVIETGAASAAAISQNHAVLVLATDATVQSHAYAQACAVRGLRAQEKACPLLVPLIEEGWTEHPVTAEVLRIYLEEAMQEAQASHSLPDTVLLGCTHYPLLRPLLERTLPSSIRIVDSAETTAASVRQDLETRAMLPVERCPANRTDADAADRCRFFATDSIQKFRQLGSRFLGHPIQSVGLIDMGG
jgi:glutamate racemase